MNRPIQSLELEMKEFLDSILEGMKTQLGSEEDPSSLFGYKDGEIYWELRTESRRVYLHWFKIWEPMVEEFKPYLELRRTKLEEFFRTYFQEYLALKNLSIYYEIDPGRVWNFIKLK